MQVQINTGHGIDGTEAVAARARDTVEKALARVSTEVTRVEVHLKDQDGDKDGQDDKQCKMEARLAGRQPIVVTHRAGTVEAALDGAAARLARAIESTLGRSADRRPREPKA